MKQAYQYDKIALRLSKKIISDPNEFANYQLVERLFIILPYMHSENVEDCEKSIKLIGQNIKFAEDNNYEKDMVKQLKGLKTSA